MTYDRTWYRHTDTQTYVSMADREEALAPIRKKQNKANRAAIKRAADKDTETVDLVVYATTEITRDGYAPESYARADIKLVGPTPFRAFLTQYMDISADECSELYQAFVNGARIQAQSHACADACIKPKSEADVKRQRHLRQVAADAHADGETDGRADMVRILYHAAIAAGKSSKAATADITAQFGEQVGADIVEQGVKLAEDELQRAKAAK